MNPLSKSPITTELSRSHIRQIAPVNAQTAALNPIERPAWAENLRDRSAGGREELARVLLKEAEDSGGPGQTAVALRAVEADENGCLELEVNLTVGPRGLGATVDDVARLRAHTLHEPAGKVGGIFQPTSIYRRLADQPMLVTQPVYPEFEGWYHYEIASYLRFASPDVFGFSGSINCREYDIRGESSMGVFATWFYWYADWEPVTYRELVTTVNSVSTVSSSSLQQLGLVVGMEIRPIVRAKWVNRPEPFDGYEVKSETFWL